MPPKNAVPRFPRAAFKPPRPISQSTPDEPPAPERQTSKRPANMTKPYARPNSNNRNATTHILSSSEDEDDNINEVVTDNDATNDHDCNARKMAATLSEPAIPRKLLARLLHEHFEHDDTRITKEAMTVFAKYVELFAREAIARAISERREISAQEGGSRLGVDFLEVN